MTLEVLEGTYGHHHPDYLQGEAARLLWAAYRNPKARHLARFILVALYTGTRSEAILRLRFMPHTAGGHVDTEAGRIYRRGAGQTETRNSGGSVS